MVFYNKGYGNASTTIANYLGVSVGLVSFLLVVVIIWTLVWKGLALWKSSKKNHTIWFIVLLIVNTVGILEILYIYIFSNYDGKKSLNKEKIILLKKEKVDKKKKK